MTINLFQSIKVSANRINLNRTTRRVALIGLFVSLAIGNAWAGGGSSNYYASLKINAAGATGGGSVYVANSSTKPGTANPGTAVKSAATTSSGGNVTMYWWVDINPGYNVSLSGKVTGGPYSAASANGSVSCAAATNADGTQAYTATATFVAVTVNSVDNTSIALNPTNPSTDYPFTVTFSTSNLKTIALDLVKSPETADGKFTITNWALDGTNVVATGKFNGGGTYGGASRNNSTTISLQSKASGSAAKTCTVTANFPALEFVNATETDVFTTTSDATKTGTAVFNFNYGAEDDFPNAPTFTHTSGAGAFTIVGNPVIEPNFSDGTCKVTVNYQFNPNGTAGTTQEELKITSVGGLVSSVTVTGEAEAEATDDAKVIAADGETLIYQGDWATAWTKANTAANAGCTLQVLRDITGSSLNANQTVTNTFTLDLNGKVLTAKYNGSIIYVNKSGKTITIKDSKTGGKIQNINNDYAGTAYLTNVAAGNLILESGTLYAENKGEKDRKAVAIYHQAGTTVTMNGGRAEAWGYTSAFGVYQVSNKNNNTTFTMNNGEVVALGYTDTYGINGNGKVNINAGTIDATATYSNSRGISLTAAASATAANCYYGTLTMKGGTINSNCTADADGTRYAYGIVLEGSYTAYMGTGVATDGSHANKAAATGTIENATINVSTLGRYAYGVLANGSYQSKTNKYSVIKIKDTKIDVTSKYYYTYGVYANCGINGTNGGIYAANIELTDCEVNATTTKNHTAYAVFSASTATTIFKDKQPNYYGEYAGGATLTINSGTYTATTGTTTAYAAASSTRSVTVYDPESSVIAERTRGGEAEGFAKLIIHGGTFKGISTTTTARAVSSGGITTIDGGEFEAYAGTTTAYGLYAVSGKLTASGVKVTASATGTAYGAVADAGIPTGNAAQTGFAYAGELVLNNCDITATTRTSTEARGVLVNATNKLHNWAQFLKDSTSYTSTWAANKSNYAAYYRRVFPCTVEGRDSVGISIAGKATINGCTIKATAETTTAYGVYAIGSQDLMLDSVALPELTVKNTEITVATNGTKGVNGIYTQGETLVDGCDITATSKTETCYGIQALAANDAKVTVKKTKITASGTTTVYGLYGQVDINAKNGQDRHGSFVLEAGNEVTATATSGNTSYALFLNATKRAITTPATIPTDYSAYRLGNYANAATAIINDGTYKATATGTTAYALGVAAQQVQVAGSVVGRPEISVNNGKFWGKATGGTDGAVNGNGQMNYVVLKGGFYNVNTNLSKYVYEGLNVNSLTSGPEYDEGYRYTISSKATGSPVCKVYQNGTTDKGSYATLKEALQFVNANTANTYTVVMIDNHTLPKGNYTIPSKVTLIVPNSLTQKAAMGDTPSRVTGNPSPVQLVMLTFDKGVNMTVYGGIETTAQQNEANGGSAITGAPTGNYGRLHLVEGSKITLESGSKFNCWGYCTGKGEITAMSGSTVREGFQLGYWRGGNATSSMLSNRNSWKAFPVTDYFIQNVEAPILFRPGSDLYGYTGVNTGYGAFPADNIHLLGSTSSLFLMESADASADTWVRKEYDPATDRAIWTVNSGAKLGQFSFKIVTETVESKDYYMPISNNMTIYINEGEFTVTQDALLIPGAQIIISKLGKLTVSSGKRLFVMDNEDWPGFQKADGTVTRWYYNATYSPSWTTNPRTTKYPPTTTRLPDAEIFVHGTTEGQYYTTEHGANIHSTNEDAGVVRFVAAAGANTSIQHVVNTDCNRVTINFTSAKLKNEDTSNPYTSTAGTVAGDAYTYMDQMWVNVKENGCLLTKTDGTGTHDLAHPSDVVAVVANSDDNAYHSETGSRKFIFAEKKVTTAGCVWWEAEKVTTGDHVGDYMANKEQFDNYGGYYYWDNSAGYWKPRTVTVTWKNYDGSALATYSNVIYNTSPHYSSASPKVPANTSTATYAWTGWDDPQGNFHHRDSVLPRVTGNITYTAHIQETKYEYLITFKNDAGKVIHTEMFEAGTVPVCPAEKLVKDATASQVFTFSNWQGYAAGASLPAVTAAATYTAVFTASPRKYTVTFVDYDMSFLVDTLISYGTVAKFPTSLHEEPYRESTDAFSYEWIGWTKTLAAVTKDVTYVAKYKQTTIKYRVIFKSDCWGQNDGADDCVEKIHSTKDYALGATVVVPANPSRPQTAQYTYTFDHWDPAVVTTVEAGGATYTAVYTKTPRTYAISYKDKNNAAFSGTHGSGYPTTHTYNTSETLVNPTKTGYDFEGWYSVADCSSGKITKIPADVAAAYTVYANWTPKTNTAYIVKHYKQKIDGTYANTPDKTDNLTGTTGASVTPAVETYTGFTSPATQTKTILADGSLVIEYKYTRNSYKLTWALAGGTVTVAGTGAAVGATGSPYSNVKYDDAITAPTVTRTGYTFAGWDATPAAKMPAEAKTYTAQWNPITYNIIYKDQNNATFSGTHGSGYPTTHTYGTATTLVNPTKTGYTFGGWYTDAECAVTKVTSLAATGYTANITLYAKWTANSYNITYKNKDNATFTGTHEDGYPTSHTYGTTTNLDSPTRTGYIFDAYYTSSDCSTGKVTSLSATGYTSAITLYANWTPITYNITYKDQNNATFSGTHGSGYPTTHTYGTATPLVNPTKIGYDFKGWYTASDCASGKVTSLAGTTYTADITLYALWAASTTTPYTVEHYQQNINDDNYPAEPFETQSLKGTTGTEVTPAVKSYTGFTAPSTQTKTVAADGSMVIKYYYTRNSYELTWDANGGTLSGTYTSGSVKFGATITVPTATRTGYTFNAWSATVPETMPASAKSFKATWTCVSPTSLTITSEGNKWDFCTGETMTLTVDGADIASDAKYQWKKWNSSTEAWSNISGATSASYSVTMAAANALQYCCAVTNGTCTTQSDGVWVRVWQLYINNGASNAWTSLDFTNTGANTGSNTTVALIADKTYQFKLKDNNGGWFGLNDKTVTRTESAFALNGTGADVNVTAGMTGNYTFTIDYSNKNNPTIAITYPTANQPAGKNIYFDKSVIAGWGDKIYYRIGHPTYNTNTGDAAWTLVPGTDNFYTTQTMAFNGFEAWQIANNASWSGENSIYKVDGSGYAITRATNFQKYVVGDNGVTIVPTEFNNTETGCNYWHVAVTEGMLTHTATITTPTNGTITIANTAQSLEATATTANIPHRTILTITATPAIGYKLSSLKVNGADFTSGNTFILAADAVIEASFESAETGFYVDIVDVDNTNKKLVLNVTGWPSNGWSAGYTVNGTSYLKTDRKEDRTLVIPYTGSPGETFWITVTNEVSGIVSLHSYIIPTELNEDKNMSDLSANQVIYVKGATLTIDAKTTVKKIFVAPDAQLVVNSELKADSVFLRTTPWAAAQLEKNATINAQVLYTRIVKDKNYNQFGLPLSCGISAVHLSDGTTVKYGTGWLLRSYSESLRATNGTGDDITNWETLTGTEGHNTIIGGVGYEMYSASKYYREFYFPVDLKDLTTSVTYTCSAEKEGDAGAKNRGWNFLVSPLTKKYVNNPKPEDIVLAWLQPWGYYVQEQADVIMPAIPFGYQASKNGSLSFEKSTIVSKAPRRVKAADEETQVQWIRLDIADEAGSCDQTSVYSHPTRYEETYQSGIDVNKHSLTASRAILYSTHAYGNMAFAGVSDKLFEQGVALTVYNPKEQELTFSLRQNEWLNRMAYVWLTDTETGAVIDLLDSDYTITLPAGKIEGRFILSGRFFAPQITTDVDNVQDSEGPRAKAQKLIIDQKMYIKVNGLLYDATGKKVKGK